MSKAAPNYSIAIGASIRYITEMEEALSWILLLEPIPNYLRKLVWL
jgi:hypothetical protein